VCLDPATGKTAWIGAFPESRTPYYSSPVIANGILYAAREDGVVFTAGVGDKFELLGENPMRERIVASPVPVRNKLLLRGDLHLFCVGTP
jgi:outer membrane protein assembly factor BamB